ncbi:MAG: HAMP domain-containing histidine kinase [Gemmatimonadetes bacterium]|nr:HAMP domain-containing histidine kinase [Gemmatimonadota bacterium]
MTYAARSIAGTLLVLVVTVGVLVVGVKRSLRHELEQETRNSLTREAELFRSGMPADSAAWQGAVAEAARATGIRITVIDRTGRVVAESGVRPEDQGRIENHAERPEVAAALRGTPGFDQRLSATTGERLIYVAVPGGPGVVRMALPLDQIGILVSRAQRPVLVVALVALLLGTVLALVAARRSGRPLSDIAKSAQSIARGETPRFPFSGIPDVDQLTTNLRQMHDQLTERFEILRRKQAETAAIVDSMVEGVLSSDAKGRILTANPAVRRLLGYGETDQLPELALLFRTKDAREALATVLIGESIADRELSLGDRTYLLNARPLPTGGAVVVLHDLTRLKRLETVRRDFVANASHELKTPLTAISGYAETLLADEPGPAITKRFLETILSNALRMQRLVDDQLDLSRIESGAWTPRLDDVAIEPAAREAWALATATEPAAPNFSVELAPEATWITADADGLRQIFRNLFENAVRHTAPSGRVTVTATSDDGGIRLSVTDTGAGIGSEHLPRIFERFYRVDPSRSREQGGTGLGLAIVKHLVEGHGGRVWAESTLGAGTTIQIQWPATPS